jgi:hypothetical protein
VIGFASTGEKIFLVRGWLTWIEFKPVLAGDNVLPMPKSDSICWIFMKSVLQR